MSSSPSRFLSIALGAVLAVGATLATVPAYADPEDTEPGSSSLACATDDGPCETATSLVVNPYGAVSITRPDGVIVSFTPIAGGTLSPDKLTPGSIFEGNVTFDPDGTAHINYGGLCGTTISADGNMTSSGCMGVTGPGEDITTGSGTVPVPSVPDSDVAKDKIVSPETTGGAARLADGSDTYTLVTTIRDENGQLLTGYLSHLSASVASDTADPTKVTLKNYRENTDKPGTYSIDVSSATPGNFIVTVAYDNTPLDTTTPAGADLHTTATPVNFIGADVAQPSRLIGDPQSSDGLGFLPGEDVTVTVHSDPLSLGTYKADGKGNVNVSFVTDKLDVGRHNVTFYGTTSGTVEAGFDVVVTPRGDTGGTAVNPSSTSALVLVFAFVAAGAFSLAMGLRRRTH